MVAEINIRSKIYFCLLVPLLFGPCLAESDGSNDVYEPVYWMRFLVSVFHRYDALNGCKSTNKTSMIKPGDESAPIINEDCDKGHLHFTIKPLPNGKQNVTIFYNSLLSIVDEVVTCSIFWNGEYLVPSQPGVGEAVTQACTFTKPQGSYGFTIYWFHLLEWVFE